MLLDAATLRDLEILSPLSPQGQTVWSLVDRTRTLPGRRALRDLLLASLNSSEDILERQRAHQELSDESSTIVPAIHRMGCDRVEQYVHMAWQLPAEMRRPAPVIGRLWPTWYRHYLKEARHGRQNVVAFLDAAADLGRHLSSTKNQTLRQIGDEILRLFGLRETQELLSLGRQRSARSLLAFDQRARGTANTLLKELLERIGTVEAMWSMAAATVEHGWLYPTPGRRFAACGLRHPFLGSRGVPNDLQLTEEVRVCFVTGPNMAGKSTFLKTVATAMLLAHAGCGVPATSMTFPVVGAVFSSVQIFENFSGGESFYLAEVRRIKALAAALRNGAPGLAVVDEPFRGTNVHDAAEATLAIITRLAAHPRALVLIASHVAEIAPEIALDARIRLLHFSANVIAEQPTFDYRLRDGVSTQRLGMTLLKQEQVLDLLGDAAP